MMTEKEQYLNAVAREFTTTVKVLKAFPAAKGDLKPHAKSKNARDLAWNFVIEEKACDMALDGAIQFAKLPPSPATFPEVISSYEKSHAAFVERVKRTPDADLNKTVKFTTGPKKVEDLRTMDIFWMMLMDAVHHRGQFSVYLRMADGKVPSIYGPTADEPWM
jgi:uncharacterized damage-inducible protein DinB